MALVPTFCGGFYQALSPVIAADTAVNVYTETREVPGAQKTITLYGTPGLDLDDTVATAGCRGWFSENGRTFVVVGAALYERTGPGTYSSLGAITNDTLRVSFASNGKAGDQVGIVGGGELKVFNTATNTLSSAITLPFANPVTITFQDGYGLINQAETPTVWYSALEDLTSWDALDFFTRSTTSDNVVAITDSRDRIWVLGEQTATLYYDAGDADNPFVPYPGTSTQIGLVAPTALGLHADVLYFVGVQKGTPQVYRASDPQPQLISTPPIDRWLAGCVTLTDAEIDLYEQEGHPFIVLTCPSSPDDIKTYVYDVREQLWHARASWDSTSGQWLRWRVRGVITVDNEVLAGDATTGDLYTLNLDTFDENTAILRRERTVPYLSSENQWLFLDQIELGMQAGVGLSSGQGSDPQVLLSISRDGARTFIEAGPAALGPQGAYTDRAIWRRLGRARADRLVLRIVQTDPVKTVWGPGLWVRTTQGTGAL